MTIDQHDLMQSICEGIDKVLNGEKKGKDRTLGFVLCVFPFGKPGRLNYASNGDSEDILVLAREMVARLECRLHEGPKEPQ